MKLVLTSKNAHTPLFVSIFQVLKNCLTHVALEFKESHMYIQGMDKSHVCLFDILLPKEWFNEYTREPGDSDTIGIFTSIFSTILSSNHGDHDIDFQYKGDPDQVDIHLLKNSQKNGFKLGSSGDFNCFYKLPIVDINYEKLDIPEVEYDAEFSICAHKMSEVLSRMGLFGETIRFTCKEDSIDITSQGENGEMTVEIPMDHLKEYSVIEGETIEVTYSLSYLNKMIVSTKLSNTIDFFISKETPMKVRYDLGEGGHMVFYLAPKVED